jgi:hypothetical protein
METFTLRWLAAWSRSSVMHWNRLVESGEIPPEGVIDLRGAGTGKSMLRITRPALVKFLESRRSV